MWRNQKEWAGKLAPGDNTGRLPTERIIYHAAKKKFCQDFQKVAKEKYPKNNKSSIPACDRQYQHPAKPWQHR